MAGEEKIKIFTIALFVLMIAPAVYPAAPTAAKAAARIEPDSCLVDRGKCIVRAVRTTNGGIKVDGILGESDWKHAPVTSGFIQHEPHDGEPATEKTDVRIVYDDYAIYVGVRAYDREARLRAIPQRLGTLRRNQQKPRARFQRPPAGRPLADRAGTALDLVRIPHRLAKARLVRVRWRVLPQ